MRRADIEVPTLARWNSGGDKPVIPGSLSAERWPFHTEPPDQPSSILRPAEPGFAVKLPYTLHSANA